MIEINILTTKSNSTRLQTLSTEYMAGLSACFPSRLHLMQIASFRCLAMMFVSSLTSCREKLNALTRFQYREGSHDWPTTHPKTFR